MSDFEVNQNGPRQFCRGVQPTRCLAKLFPMVYPRKPLTEEGWQNLWKVQAGRLGKRRIPHLKKQDEIF